MKKVKALGTTLSYLPAYDSVASVIAVGSLTSIGEISCSSGDIDVTTLDSPGWKEFIQGAKEMDELPLKGFHNSDAAGQAEMRSLFETGAFGYFWVTFPDQTVIAFTAYVNKHAIGAPDVNGAVSFGCALKVVGQAQIISTAYDVVGDVLDATASTEVGTPAYQWYSNDAKNYDSPTIISGETSATYDTTGTAGYYFCKVTVPNYRPVNSQIFEVV